MENKSSPVCQMLKQTSKGKLVYDREWERENRIQDVMSDIQNRLSQLYVCPKTTDEDNEEMRRQDNHPVIEEEAELSIHEVKEELECYEEIRKENVRCSIDAYSRGVYDYLQETEDEAEIEVRCIKQKHLQSAIDRINGYQEEYRRLMTGVIGKQSSLSSLQDSISNRLQEVSSKHQEAVAAKEREVQQKLQTEITQIRTRTHDMISDELIPLLSDMSTLDPIPPEIMNYGSSVYQDVMDMFNAIVQRETSKSLSPEDVKQVLVIQKQIEEYISQSKTQLKQMKKDAESKPKAPVPQMETTAVVTPAPTVAKKVTHAMPGSNVALKSYFMRQKSLAEFEDKLKPFVDNPEIKPYRLNLQQFIRTNINAISTGSNEHLRQKFKNLNKLLSGEWIEFQDKKINATKYPDSLNFCLSYAAKTFISVGSKQVLSVPKAAFPMAAVIGLLWSKHPIFGQIFMWHLEEKCPYVGVYYPKREVGEPETSHLLSCGYVFGADNETLESEESFLNRMRAFLRMYGAIVASNIGSEHPQGISCGWLWLTQTLSVEPTPAVSAAILHAFLSASFYKFLLVYKSQAVKLINFLKKDYLKRIEQNTGPDVKRQSIVQLEMLTDEYLKKIRTKKDLKPDGVISDYFFQKTYLNSA